MNLTEVIYIPVKEIQQVLTLHYKTYHTYLTFQEAIKLLINKQIYSSVKPSIYNCNLNEFLEQADFEALLLSYPVNVKQILDTKNNSDIFEINIIPSNHDIFGFHFLHYMKDYIHTHDYFEINYVYSGSAKQFFLNETRTLYEGELCIIAPNSYHNILCMEDSLVITIMVRKSTFDSVFGNVLIHKDLLSIFFRNVLYNNSDANYLMFVTDKSDEIKKMFQQIVIESNCDDEYSNNCCISQLNLLFAHIMRNYSKTISYYNYADNNKSKLDFTLLLQYMQSNYRTVTLTSLAAMFHYHEVYLSRLIKINLNRNFSDVIRDLKMKHAVDYLDNTSYHINEIAELVGYDSLDHFSKVFKRFYNIPPTQYRTHRKTQALKHPE